MDTGHTTNATRLEGVASLAAAGAAVGAFLAITFFHGGMAVPITGAMIGIVIGAIAGLIPGRSEN